MHPQDSSSHHPAPAPASAATTSGQCAVALHVQLTRDGSGGHVEIVRETHAAELGAPEEALRALLSQHLDNDDLTGALDALDRSGPIDARRPLILERLQLSNKWGLFVEARSLPVLPATATAVAELLAEEPSDADRGELLVLVASELDDYWRGTEEWQPPRFLDDDAVLAERSSGVALAA